MMELPRIVHELRPLSFSDLPGYTLTYKGNFRRSPAGATVSFDVESVKRVGWWQPGWFTSLFRTQHPVTRHYVGSYWRFDDEHGECVDYNLYGGLDSLCRMVERHYRLSGLDMYPPKENR